MNSAQKENTAMSVVSPSASFVRAVTTMIRLDKLHVMMSVPLAVIPKLGFQIVYHVSQERLVSFVASPVGKASSAKVVQPSVRHVKQERIPLRQKLRRAQFVHWENSETPREPMKKQIAKIVRQTRTPPPPA